MKLRRDVRRINLIDREDVEIGCVVENIENETGLYMCALMNVKDDSTRYFVDLDHGTIFLPTQMPEHGYLRVLGYFQEVLT